MDRNALDWLFSTAPQALAALVGLFFTGITFFNSVLEKKIEKDETSEDIYKEMKREIHTKMKTMFWLAGFAILFDLLLIILNPIEDNMRFSFNGTFDFYLFCVTLVFLLNIITIIFAFIVVVRIMRPTFFEDALKRLSEKLKSGTVKAMDFIEEFIKLESALRSLPIEILDLPVKTGQRYQHQPTIKEIIYRLKLREEISVYDFDRMLQLNHIRNLILHNGEIISVDKSSFEDVKTYTEKILKIKEKLDSQSKGLQIQ